MHRKTTTYPTSSRRPVFSLPGVGLMLGLVLTTAAIVVAEQPPLDNEPKSESIEAPAAAGWRVYVDPETGELTNHPSPLQVKALSRRLESTLSRSSEDLEPFELRLGGRGVFLQERFQSALRVRVVDGGGLEMSCVDAGHTESSDPGSVHPHGAHPHGADPYGGHEDDTTELPLPAQPVSTTVQWVER